MRSHDGAAPPRTRLTMMAVMLMAAAPARNLLLDPAGLAEVRLRFHTPKQYQRPSEICLRAETRLRRASSFNLVICIW